MAAHTLTGGLIHSLVWHALASVEGAYLGSFGLLMATAFLWLAQGPPAVARAAGVVRLNGGISWTKTCYAGVFGHREHQ